MVEAMVEKNGQQSPKQKKVSITIIDAFQRQQMHYRPSQLNIPAVPAKAGSTADYPRFNIERESVIVEFVNNLCSYDGGARSPAEARQIASDVSKYLA